MNIDEMEAGREMDALVAEKVMGWTLDPEGCWLDREDNYADTGWGAEQNTYDLPVWAPSIDILAACEVVKKAADDKEAAALAICQAALETVTE